MHAGYRLEDGHRVDVSSDKTTRRVRVEIACETAEKAEFSCTPSEARAIASAFMGAAHEA
jgi:hypothetical protein